MDRFFDDAKAQWCEARRCPGGGTPGSLEVLEDFPYHQRLGDEGENPHLGSAGAKQRIRFKVALQIYDDLEDLTYLVDALERFRAINSCLVPAVST